jgi:hypothetical protein
MTIKYGYIINSKPLRRGALGWGGNYERLPSLITFFTDQIAAMAVNTRPAAVKTSAVEIVIPVKSILRSPFYRFLKH